MKVHQLVEIRKTLDDLSKHEGIEFAYSVYKNKIIIDKKLSELDFIKNIEPEVVEYENKRIQLCEDSSEKDNSGKPIIENDLYKIVNIKEFESKIEELNHIYEPFLKKRQLQIDLFNTKMNEDCELDFHKINISDLPKGFKTAEDLDLISFMLK